MTFNFPFTPIITNEDEARECAIEWQNWQSEQSLSIGDMQQWHEYFEALVEIYPDLRDEFQENGIT